MKNFLRSLFYIATMIGAVIAFVILMGVTVSSEISAPQQAGSMAVALGWVIIPYCWSRAFEQLTGR